MTYPLPSGTTESGVTTFIVPPIPPLVKMIPTRVAAAIPLPALGPGYQRSGVTKAILPPIPPVVKFSMQRQWGLAAPITGIIADSWGVF